VIGRFVVERCYFRVVRIVIAENVVPVVADTVHNAAWAGGLCFAVPPSEVHLRARRLLRHDLASAAGISVSASASASDDASDDARESEEQQP
jgi:hypothetical protein